MASLKVLPACDLSFEPSLEMSSQDLPSQQLLGKRTVFANTANEARAHGLGKPTTQVVATLCAIALRDTEQKLGEEFAGSESWAWLPKFCRTFGVLCEGSSARFLLCKRFRRIPCRTPKVPRNSGGGEPGPEFSGMLFFPPKHRTQQELGERYRERKRETKRERERESQLGLCCAAEGQALSQ